MLNEWLKTTLQERRISQAELSRILTDRLKRAIDRAAVNKMVSGKRAIAADELQEIEAIFGEAAPNPGFNPEVSLKGYVGAGQVVFPVDDGGDDTVPAPASAKPGTVAVRIRGDSMFPTYEEGTLLYYSRQLPPSELVNRRCVVRLGNGSMYIKVLRPGSDPNLWTLQSINVTVPDMIDQVVEWAAPIDWMKPMY
jgi:phage repressor protein C with HTH and peptisase S24 domain